MPSNSDTAYSYRVLSIVEALTVTGPIKPILMFSPVARGGLGGRPPICHALMTTRRRSLLEMPECDELAIAAKSVGLEFIPIPERGPLDPSVYRKMLDSIRTFAPNIIETHSWKHHFFVWTMRTLNADMRKVRWIAFHHGYTRTSWKIRAYQKLDWLTLRFAEAVVTLCKPFAQMLNDRGVSASRLHVISNAVATRLPPTQEAISATRKAHDIGPHERVIISVGRLSTEKGQVDLLNAFAQIVRSAPGDVRLVFVGDGPDRDILTRLAAPLGKQVIFTGHVSDPWPWFHAANIFALPSHSEGSPLVLFEAMLAGIPIVATTVGGVPETVTDNNSALLIPPSNVSALTAALQVLLNEPNVAGKLVKGATEALSRFTPTTYANSLLSIYDEVIANKQP